MTVRLSRPVDVRRLAKEEHIRVEATPQERAEIAEALDLVALDRLTADVMLRPWRGDGVQVSGTVEAEGTQACVVSLEPVPAAVTETFEMFFHPDAAPKSVVDVDPDSPDPPEPLEGSSVDVGSVVLEHFVLGLPPYPRAAGVEFSPPEEEEREPSPFAALAALKNNQG